MQILPAAQNDVEDIIGLLDTTGLRTNIDTPEILRAVIAKTPASILVAKDDSHVVGCVFILAHPWVSALYHLAVSPAHQKKGIGAKLLAAAEGEARKEGSTAVTLYIKEESGVARYYAKHGYSADRTYLSLDKRL